MWIQEVQQGEDEIKKMLFRSRKKYMFRSKKKPHKYTLYNTSV